MLFQMMTGTGTMVRAAMLRCYGDTMRHADAIALADGGVIVVPRADLASAKALHAAHNVAERRAAAGIVAKKPPRLLEKAV